MIRALTWALVIFFVWYMLTSPDGAAAWVHGFLGWIAHAGSSVSSFVDSLLGELRVMTVIVAVLAATSTGSGVTMSVRQAAGMRTATPATRTLVAQ